MTASDKEQPLVQHLLELRTRLLRTFFCLLIIFVCLFPFATQIYAIISAPLQAVLPQGTSMIATDVISPFLTPLKLTFYVALFLSVPYMLYQIWAFIAPGLYIHEKQLAAPLLISSVLLFFTGMAFAYFLVLPMLFNFTMGIELEGVSAMTDITKYLDLVLHMLLAFGFAFEIPVATVLMIHSGIVSADSLASKRRYIVVGCFVVGMLLTPPDIFSQTLLAIPMWMLFEAGLFFGRLVQKRSEERARKET
ncbi:twin-arginine translocase subunit TatC [Cellvibrio japonicus]|uniref:Sec-independent protein translocase protein TatC n=1 Tax=Cellvibrio japonicus (strain Ueda107) TaxID=498211 RepID=B3PK79_CELJU|nr:twin-arginine translocase subunit TatC [Cellvibrio japonicus]ACE82710.1 Sec-independent protein translocase TatC [Cellvibrio japonicus Ueda107]QEI11397.1 twin-arginine translocase subunit TatC [Cellvibrio japonicus]QEI14971.1 twin-arginine translocase subunit TatC [Cellvibrio japonicus]QEI18551.1 twin-arginine translocase subunit TatC [Cellvibrio japonicus]